MPTDWAALETEGVQEVIGRAARRVADNYSSIYEYDDLVQEATIFVATRDDLLACIGSDELGLGALHTRLSRDLVNLVTTEAGRRSKSTSYEHSMEVLADRGF